MKRVAIAVVLVVGLFGSGSAYAALCNACKDKMFIMSLGRCKFCGGQTSSGAFKICAKCSAAKGLCQACGKAMVGAAGKTGDGGQKDPASKPASQPAETSGKTDPEGLPLAAKLTVAKDTYKLDPEQSGEPFVRKLEETRAKRMRLPDPPAVEMTFELTNTGKEPITVLMGSDSSSLNLTLEGPGAVTVPYTRMRTNEFRMGKETVIEPGKSITIPVAKLLHGMRGDASASYWTAPGEYTIKASYVSPITGLANVKEGQRVTVTSASVKVKVEQGKSEPTSKPADKAAHQAP